MKEILENKDLRKFPFDLPEGYFTSLEERVKMRIDGESKKKGVGLFRTFKATLALAASFILILAIGGIILKYSTSFFNKNNDILAQESDVEGIVDSLNSVYMAEQLYEAYSDGDMIEFTAGTDIDVEHAELTDVEGFEDVVTDYLDQLPSSFSHLIAEYFK